MRIWSIQFERRADGVDRSGVTDRPAGSCMTDLTAVWPSTSSLHLRQDQSLFPFLEKIWSLYVFQAGIILQ